MNKPAAWIEQYRLNGELQMNLVWDDGERDDREYVPLYRLEPVARTLSPEAGAVACEHENTSPHWDCISCDDCGAVLVSGPEWGVASRKWFKDKAEAKFFKNHGRFPVFDERSAQVAHPPASQVSEEITACLPAPIDYRDKSEWTPQYCNGFNDAVQLCRQEILATLLAAQGVTKT